MPAFTARRLRQLVAPVVLSLASLEARAQVAPLPVQAPVTPAHVVEITAQGMTFSGPETARPGWTILRLQNPTDLLHFAVLQRLPEGKSIDDHQAEIAPVFQNIMDSINGRPLSRPELGTDLPAWFAQVQFLGGPGLVSGHRTAENHVYLEPGVYLLECYVKTGGIFHSFHPSPGVRGMVHQIHVSGRPHETSEPPLPTVDIAISGERGIDAPATLPAGSHLVAVRFVDQKTHQNHLGHDVHVVRVPKDGDWATVASWLDWTQPRGLQTPAPAEFLGGTHEMPAGQIGYFRVDLEPGDYAWIAEVPNPGDKGMLKPFSVRAP